MTRLQRTQSGDETRNVREKRGSYLNTKLPSDYIYLYLFINVSNVGSMQSHHEPSVVGRRAGRSQLHDGVRCSRYMQEAKKEKR